MKKLLTGMIALSMGTLMFAGQPPAQKPGEPASQTQPAKKHKKEKTHKEKTEKTPAPEKKK